MVCPVAPVTTVMMAAHDSHGTVRESVESVLAQTVPDLELIVVDDRSSPPIGEALREVADPRLRVVRHRGKPGPGAARNTALRLARTPFVSQLDSDDIWHPEYLESILPRFDDPDVGLVYANVNIRFHPAGRDIAITDTTPHPVYRFPRMCDACEIPSATPTMRREAVLSIGGYAEWLLHTEDYHLYLKLARAGWRFDYVHRPLATYSWPTRERGMSFRREEAGRDALKMWLAFTLRHPLTPGPRRQARRRLARHLRRRLGLLDER
ncbi:MAG TPA: glycosyltransferase family 2 protein [Thermoleophilaceae bacterium]|nr:glycosyltransferase family 2 protein [Thermoleophilaceae bacterium]